MYSSGFIGVVTLNLCSVDHQRFEIVFQKLLIHDNPHSAAIIQDQASSQDLNKPFSQLYQSISESPAHSPLINEQSILSADSSLIKELDQPPSWVDQSISPAYSPLIQDQSMLSDSPLIQDLDHPLYPYDIHEDIMTGSPQNSLSNDDHMDLVVPHIDEQTHLLPFPEVSVEWYKRQNALSTKNASRKNIQHPIMMKVLFSTLK